MLWRKSASPHSTSRALSAARLRVVCQEHGASHSPRPVAPQWLEASDKFTGESSAHSSASKPGFASTCGVKGDPTENVEICSFPTASPCDLGKPLSLAVPALPRSHGEQHLLPAASQEHDGDEPLCSSQLCSGLRAGHTNPT